jgi:hypothetical protein
MYNELDYDACICVKSGYITYFNLTVRRSNRLAREGRVRSTLHRTLSVNKNVSVSNDIFLHKIFILFFKLLLRSHRSVYALIRTMV